MLRGTIKIDVYNRELHDALSYAATALWSALVEQSFLPPLIGQAVQLPDQLSHIDGGIWFGRSEGAVPGTFFVWDLEVTYQGIKAMIAFQPDDEGWAPEIRGNWKEVDLIPDLERWACGVKFSVNSDEVYIKLVLG